VPCLLFQRDGRAGLTRAGKRRADVFKQPILIRMFLALSVMPIISTWTSQDKNEETATTEAAAADFPIGGKFQIFPAQAW
jgi:hypothetical protein